jgi:hypothetical protein
VLDWIRISHVSYSPFFLVSNFLPVHHRAKPGGGRGGEYGSEEREKEVRG